MLENNENIFCVDIGGSKLVCGALTREGEILDTVRYDYPANYDLDMLIGFIREAYAKLSSYPFEYCGAAIPGLCDPERGLWLYSSFSGLADIPIANILTEMTGLTTYVDNDVNISALAERYFGVCKNERDFMWITVSNGIGGGVYLDGRLYRGPRMTSGEIGHVIVEEDESKARLCGCGSRGCLEAMASGASIGAIYNERMGTSLTAKDVAALAYEGDAEAIRVWSEAGAYIGKAAACAANLFGIGTFVLGGGAAEAFELLYPSADAALKKYVFTRANPDVRILHSEPGRFAALKGCAALVLDSIG